MGMDVRAWLDQLGLSEFAVSFAENGVDAAMLPELTNDDLKDLGVLRLADRKRLLKAITGLAEFGISLPRAARVCWMRSLTPWMNPVPV